MTKNRTTEQRRIRIRKNLRSIVLSAEAITSIMKDVPYRNATKSRSLGDSPQYLVVTKSGFTASYKDNKGDLYEINIHKRKK
ncbi:MAG: hypothetical protein PHH54_04805 [Candidatus Nanoarchaeia archaeon]|nr:hypothetical protein [Candidatus Nanoarchaeia archaeon]MDD5741277.1 hypothetical protein [Candidatus Nanoarchaeia archaeon]